MGMVGMSVLVVLLLLVEGLEVMFGIDVFVVCGVDLVVWSG